MRKHKNIFHNIWIDGIILILLGCIGIALFFFSLPRGETVVVELKLINTLPSENTENNMFMDKRYAVKKSIIDQIKETKPVKNIWNSVTAEVIDIESWGEYAKETWVTVRILVKHDKNRQTYTYNFQNIQVGETIDINLPNVKMSGIILGIRREKEVSERKTKYITVQARLIDWKILFPDTRGIEPYIAEAFSEGETMQNEKGDLVQIIKKNLIPAEKIVQTASGDVLLGRDPVKQDVFLTMRVLVTEKDGQVFFLHDKPIRIGNMIPVVLSKVSIYPIITEIERE